MVEGDRTVARRVVADVVADRRFDGDRHEFEQYVESLASARRAGEKRRPIFDEGITVHDDGLDDLRRSVITDE